MHAVFAFEVAVCKFAFDFDGHRLDASLIAVLQVDDGGFVTIGLSIAQVHTHKHGGPVLTFGAACARVDFQDAVHSVFLLAEHIFEFKGFDGLNAFGVGRIYFLLAQFALFVEVEGQLKFLDQEFHLLVAHDPFLQSLNLLHLFLGAFGIVPESRVLRTELFLFQLNGLGLNVQIAVEGFHSVLGCFELFDSYHGCKVTIFYVSELVDHKKMGLLLRLGSPLYLYLYIYI